jgi:NhaA family Na+:H+ antiporter
MMLPLTAPDLPLMSHTSPPPLLPGHSPLQRLLHHDAAAAVLLLTAAVAAFAMANMPFLVLGKPVYQWYADLWHLEAGISLHHLSVMKPLHHWINDGLMTIFFFLVGLEIKRELLVGELASVRRAMLPIMGAAGGMLAPALIYATINWGGDGIHGWGVPVATDIAFAAGVIGLLKRRVPAGLAVFLIALAIVDDLGCVLVIAIFYTEQIAPQPLFIGLALILISFALGRYGVRNSLVFGALFALVWLEFLSSGVHATVAGVLFAFTVPAGARYDTPLFLERLQHILNRFREAEDHPHLRLVSAPQQRLIRAVEAECRHVEAPLQRLENKLHGFSAFIIMPVFAFANSGVQLDFSTIHLMYVEPVTLGVMFGLMVGKPVGILTACWLSVRLGLAALPSGVRWVQMLALGCLAGIGFTMALFVAELAFIGHGGGAPSAIAVRHLAEAKVGIISGSLVAGVLGVLALLQCCPRPRVSAEAL